MSDQPEKPHPWATFRAPRRAAGPRARTGAPALPAAKPWAQPRAAGAWTAPEGGSAESAKIETPAVAAPAAAGRAESGPGVMSPRATPKPKPAAAEPAMSREDEALAAAALAEVEVPAAEAAEAARRERRRRQPWWVLIAARDSVRDWRATTAALAAWWAGWRGSATARTLAAFVVLYGLLAVMRAPSPVAVERSRQREDAAMLQSLMKDFCARGGTVFARRPHGGSELFPRGVVLQGEALEAFQRAPVGGVFVLRPGPQSWNPLAGFYSFPAVFVGGAYFHLDRPFNFSRFRCVFLVRKDSDKAGAILVARVEPAY